MDVLSALPAGHNAERMFALVSLQLSVVQPGSCLIHCLTAGQRVLSADSGLATVGGAAVYGVVRAAQVRLRVQCLAPGKLPLLPSSTHAAHACWPFTCLLPHQPQLPTLPSFNPSGRVC